SAAFQQQVGGEPRLRAISAYRKEFTVVPDRNAEERGRFMRKLAIVVALSSTVIATPALARNGAWYVGGDFGAMIVEDIGFDFGRGGAIPGGSAQIEIDHEYGYDGALFVGYDLGSFRIEAEVAYKRAD